ncbi:MAG: tetratricopeptide repeat protein [Sulfurimonas sp.]|nr:tetratricopeptide repeat protein [Sulfurimonas sp.]
MNKTIVSYLSVFLFTSITLFAEPSAFGAGDMGNPNPYGLTSEEQLLLKNKKNLKKVIVKSNNQSNKLESLRDRIDGLQDVVESLGRNAHKNKQNLKNFNQQNIDSINNSNEFENRLIEISKKNTEDIAKINLLIDELSRLIDTINENYISKKEFNALVNDVNKFKQLVAKELKSETKVNSSSSKSSGDIATEAKVYYDKQYYTDAIELYTYLIEKNYKPAYANYMIGNMKYYRKNYSEAVAYYKTSTKLYSAANYKPKLMSKLMLNSAISMKHLGDLKNAKIFFKSIIKKYPNSKYSKKAEEELSLLE